MCVCVCVYVCVCVCVCVCVLHISALIHAHTHTYTHPYTHTHTHTHSESNAASPLHFACKYGQCVSVCVLLQEGADAEHTDGQGNTPLHEALARSHLACCR